MLARHASFGRLDLSGPQFRRISHVSKVWLSIANCLNIGAVSERINEMRIGLVVKRGLAQFRDCYPGEVFVERQDSSPAETRVV
jgi:hypothetical protein